MNKLQSVIHIITAFADILLAYELYRAVFERKAKRRILTAVFFTLGAAFVLVSNIYLKSPYLRILLFSIYVFLGSFLIFKGKATSKFFVGLLFDAIYQVGDIFVFGVVLLLFPNYFSASAEINGDLIFIVGSLAFYFYMFIFVAVFRRFPFRLSGEVKRGDVLLLTSAPFLCAVVIAALQRYLMKMQSADHYIYLLPALFFIGLIFFIVLFFRTMQKAQESASAIEVYNSQLATFSGEYEALAESNRETRALRHDWKHHLDVIDGLLTGGDEDRLKKYISEIQRSLAPARISYTGDPVADIILSLFADKAKREHIDVEITPGLSRPIKIGPIDLCVLISNTTDNALEACLRAADAERRIWIDIKTNERYLTYTVKNTYEGELQKSGERFLSGKRGFARPGIGLQSVERIADKYSGYVTFPSEDGVFELISVLENRQENREKTQK